MPAEGVVCWVVMVVEDMPAVAGVAQVWEEVEAVEALVMAVAPVPVEEPVLAEEAAMAVAPVLLVA
ncbi:MAG TPA: hypothetical protein G4O01_08290 [Dehalococcoidia bacterium]|nr:hypothetical protein [Dehalococcoidia bacterium]